MGGLTALTAIGKVIKESQKGSNTTGSKSTTKSKRKKDKVKKGILGDGSAQNVINQKKKRKDLLEKSLDGKFGEKSRKDMKGRR